ncbi:MAG: type 4a pilus biogenesis protein PilO [Desulfobacteraceae bacterium]|nr:type 4a pilus biogenesis protein PilO [Desulfobacteraceae bacterium]
MIGAAVFAVVLVCFYVFVYEPKKKEGLRLQEQIKTVDLEIERIRRAIPGLEKLEEEVTREQKWVSLAKKTASDMQPMQQLLQHLARDARRLDIDVISMGLGKELEPSHEKSRYKRMTMVINIQCRYRHLGSYLKRLGDLPGLFILEGLEILRDGQIFPKLQAKLALYTFIAHEIPVQRGEPS